MSLVCFMLSYFFLSLFSHFLYIFHRPVIPSFYSCVLIFFSNFILALYFYLFIILFSMRPSSYPFPCMLLFSDEASVSPVTFPSNSRSVGLGFLFHIFILFLYIALHSFGMARFSWAFFSVFFGVGLY